MEKRLFKTRGQIRVVTTSTPHALSPRKLPPPSPIRKLIKRTAADIKGTGTQEILAHLEGEMRIVGSTVRQLGTEMDTAMKEIEELITRRQRHDGVIG